MNFFRNCGLAVILGLICAVNFFAQTEQAVESGLTFNKKLEDSKLLDNFSPLEDFLVPVETGQLISASTYPFVPLSAIALEGSARRSSATP
jgi:hypothetical protein